MFKVLAMKRPPFPSSYPPVLPTGVTCRVCWIAMRPVTPVIQFGNKLRRRRFPSGCGSEHGNQQVDPDKIPS